MPIGASGFWAKSTVRRMRTTPLVPWSFRCAGSGMRIKLAEALASGRPVITTSRHGRLALTHEEHVLVANTTEMQ